MSQPQTGEAKGGSPPENYERYFVPAIGAPMAEDLVRIAALRPGEKVLDVACGTGVVARLATQNVGPAGSVVGLDANPGMLEVARSTTPPDAAIDWHEGEAEEMPFPDGSFDVVLCQMGLQFFRDKPAALGEMRRVLAPGGRLILSVPGPTPEPFAIMEEALARHVGGQAAGFVSQVFSVHKADELQALLDGAGFRHVSLQVDDKSLRLPPPGEFLWQYVHSTPLAGAVKQVNEEARASLEREVVEMWQAFVEDQALVLQLRMLVATALL